MAATVRALGTLAACAALLGAAPARARDLSEDGRFALRTTLKSTLLVSRFPDDPTLYPEPVGADALFRLRLDAVAKPSDALTAAAAWETRLRATAPSGAATGGFLPADAAPPFRLRALDEPLATADGLAWRHELDRASVAWRAGRSEVTVGRQAIGWGRGALFGAVDLFAPFSPLEADRAWPRGVDALRADVRLGERLRRRAGRRAAPGVARERPRHRRRELRRGRRRRGARRGGTVPHAGREPRAAPRRRPARREGGAGGELPLRARERPPGLRRVPLLRLRRAEPGGSADAAPPAGLRRASPPRRHAAPGAAGDRAPRDVRAERGGNAPAPLARLTSRRLGRPVAGRDAHARRQDLGAGDGLRLARRGAARRRAPERLRRDAHRGAPPGL